MRVENRGGDKAMEDGGVNGLCRRIAEDAARQAEDILKKAEEQVSARLSRARDEAGRTARDILRRAEDDAALESKRARSRAKLDARRTELAAREALISEVMARIREELRGLAARPGYRELLVRLAVEGALSLGEGSAEMVVAARDRALVDEAFLRAVREALSSEGMPGASLKLADEELKGTGVVVRSATGRVEIDNTLEGRMERAGRELRVLIWKTLFG